MNHSVSEDVATIFWYLDQVFWQGLPGLLKEDYMRKHFKV
jgi:hypothetical protein